MTIAEYKRQSVNAPCGLKKTEKTPTALLWVRDSVLVGKEVPKRLHARRARSLNPLSARSGRSRIAHDGRGALVLATQPERLVARAERAAERGVVRVELEDSLHVLLEFLTHLAEGLVIEEEQLLEIFLCCDILGCEEGSCKSIS